MLHQNPKIVSAVVISAQLAKTLTNFVLGALLAIAVLGIFTETSSVIAGPETRVAGAFHLFGAHNNFSGWYQSTAFAVVSMLWLCLSANADGLKKIGFVLGSAAMIYMSIGELTNWDHGNWARLASYVAPAEVSHIVMSLFGAAVAACMAFWFRVMFAKHRLFLLALVIYSAGAFGFEFLSTETLMRTGISAAYVAVTSLEELMEMLGCLLLLLATFRQLVPLSDIAPNNWSCQGPA